MIVFDYISGDYPQCAMVFYLIEWYPMQYMLIANLQCVSNDIYVNADMIIKMNNDDLLNLLMIIASSDDKTKNNHT